MGEEASTIFYRHLQKIAYSGHTGTSEWEITIVTLWLVIAVFVWNSLVKAKLQRQSIVVQFLLEFALFVIPQIILFLRPNWSKWLFILIILPTIVFGKIDMRGGGGGGNNGLSQGQTTTTTTSRKIPSLTNCRAAIILMCTIGILAVDFMAFPRRFAKTESFGTSLMDVGVGSVLVSMGATAARHYRKGAGGGTSSPTPPPTLFNVTKSTLPLLFMGIIRMFLVRGFNYHENVSEYGVHWNFFVTLGLVPLLMALLYYTILPPTWSFTAGLIMAIIYQSLLSLTGLQGWLLNDNERTGIIAMNKEGIFSLLGYTALTVSSLGMGFDLFSTEPKGIVVTRKIIIRTGLLAIFYYFLTKGLAIIPSRRFANISFIVGSLLFGSFHFLAYQFVELVSDSNSSSSILLESISRNQLAFFLAGNLLTGLVNLTCRTLLQPDWLAFLILVTYTFLLSVGAVLLNHSFNFTIRI